MNAWMELPEAYREKIRKIPGGDTNVIHNNNHNLSVCRLLAGLVWKEASEDEEYQNILQDAYDRGLEDGIRMKEET